MDEMLDEIRATLTAHRAGAKRHGSTSRLRRRRFSLAPAISPSKPPGGRSARSRARSARPRPSRPPPRSAERSTRIAVPVSADGCSTRPTGRQWRIDQPYITRSTSSPGAVNSSATSRPRPARRRPPRAAADRPQRLDRLRHVVDRLEHRHEVVTVGELRVGCVAHLEVDAIGHAFGPRDLAQARSTPDRGRIRPRGRPDTLRHCDARPARPAGHVRDSRRARAEPFVHIRHRGQPLGREQLTNCVRFMSPCPSTKSGGKSA